MPEMYISMMHFLSYLELHPNNFYRVETDVDGMNFRHGKRLGGFKQPA
mgnify:CR=1 FL=1